MVCRTRFNKRTFNTVAFIILLFVANVLFFSRILNIKAKYDIVSAKVDISFSNKINKKLLFIQTNYFFKNLKMIVMSKCIGGFNKKSAGYAELFWGEFSIEKRLGNNSSKPKINLNCFYRFGPYSAVDISRLGYTTDQLVLYRDVIAAFF